MGCKMIEEYKGFELWDIGSLLLGSPKNPDRFSAQPICLKGILKLKSMIDFMVSAEHPESKSFQQWRQELQQAGLIERG